MTALSISNTDFGRGVPVPPDMAAEYARLRSLTDDALRGEFDVALVVTAQHFLKLALIVRLLEERGQDLSDLRIGMMPYLRKIGHGQFLAKLLADYGHQPAVLRKLADLPLPDQERIAGDPVLPVAVVFAGGRIEEVRVPVGDMTPQQLRTVFGPGRVRSVEEQSREIRFLQRGASPAPTPQKPPYEVNGRRCIVNRPTVLTKRDVQNILKSMG